MSRFDVIVNKAQNNIFYLSPAAGGEGGEEEEAEEGQACEGMAVAV